MPESTQMQRAYPNPFNPRTYVDYQLAQATEVMITVFDMRGRKVRTLHSGHQDAGHYHIYWNGTNDKGFKMPSGTYVIRMQTENSTQSQQVMFLK